MIVGCIMTLNNEIYIENALKSLSSVSDRIVVVDGGSTDSTIDVCRDYTDEIIINKWPGNHSEQRNVYLDYVKRNYPNSWCFNLDSDETIEPSKSKVILELCKSETKRFYWFQRKWLINVDPIAYITSPPHFPDWQLRLFKACKRTEYSGLIHENLTGKSFFHKMSGIPYVKLLSRRIIDFDIFHFDLILNSYNRRKEKARKYESIEQGSGGWNYYLPEDFATGFSVTVDSHAKPIITHSILRAIEENKQHWKSYMASKVNAF